MNAVGKGEWSPATDFEVVITPGAATTVSPSGTIGTRSPAYRWQEVSGATEYQLWVKGSGRRVHQKWHKREEICAEGLCSIGSPPVPQLEPGPYAWAVRTWNAAGLGLWSATTDFDVIILPSKPVPTAPLGSVSTDRPAFRWTTDPEALQFQLWIEDGRGAEIFKRWFRASDICSGAGCNVSGAPIPPLREGDYRFWVRGWNGNGMGPWSDGVAFAITDRPAAPRLLEPRDGISTGRPTYRWRADAGTLQYQLWIEDAAGGVLFKRWLKMEHVCTGDTCDAASPPAPDLASGKYVWWLRGWNATGAGPWAGQHFTVDIVPGAPQLLAPLGTISGSGKTIPTYEWSRVDGALQYELWITEIRDGTRKLYSRWFKAEDVCDESKCSVLSPPAPTLNRCYDYDWWVRAWNGAGEGPWSTEGDFKVSCFR